MMTFDKAYLISTHEMSFRRGKPAEIIGLIWVQPDNFENRLCYHVKWSDSVEDWVPLKDSGNFKIVSFSDIVKNYKL